MFYVGSGSYLPYVRQQLLRLYCESLTVKFCWSEWSLMFSCSVDTGPSQATQSSLAGLLVQPCLLTLPGVTILWQVYRREKSKVQSYSLLVSSILCWPHVTSWTWHSHHQLLLVPGVVWQQLHWHSHWKNHFCKSHHWCIWASAWSTCQENCWQPWGQGHICLGHQGWYGLLEWEVRCPAGSDISVYHPTHHTLLRVQAPAAKACACAFLSRPSREAKACVTLTCILWWPRKGTEVIFTGPILLVLFFSSPFSSSSSFFSMTCVLKTKKSTDSGGNMISMTTLIYC